MVISKIFQNKLNQQTIGFFAIASIILFTSILTIINSNQINSISEKRNSGNLTFLTIHPNIEIKIEDPIEEIWIFGDIGWHPERLKPFGYECARYGYNVKIFYSFQNPFQNEEYSHFFQDIQDYYFNQTAVSNTKISLIGYGIGASAVLILSNLLINERTIAINPISNFSKIFGNITNTNIKQSDYWKNELGKLTNLNQEQIQNFSSIYTPINYPVNRTSYNKTLFVKSNEEFISSENDINELISRYHCELYEYNETYFDLINNINFHNNLISWLNYFSGNSLMIKSNYHEIRSILYIALFLLGILFIHFIFSSTKKVLSENEIEENRNQESNENIKKERIENLIQSFFYTFQIILLIVFRNNLDFIIWLMLISIGIEISVNLLHNKLKLKHSNNLNSDDFKERIFDNIIMLSLILIGYILINTVSNESNYFIIADTNHGLKVSTIIFAIFLSYFNWGYSLSKYYKNHQIFNLLRSIYLVLSFAFLFLYGKDPLFYYQYPILVWIMIPACIYEFWLIGLTKHFELLKTILICILILILF